MAGSRSTVREYAFVLALGAAGAGLVLLSVHQDWAQVRTAAQGPLPAGSLSVSGQDLVPAASALGLAALAALAGVIATRRLARRAVGVVMAAFGLAVAVSVSVRISAADVLAAAHATAPVSAGSVTAGGAPTSAGRAAGLPGVGAAGHVVTVSIPWRGVVLLGALAVIAAGVLVAWRGNSWPTMSSRYDAPTGPRPRAGTDSATLWESLSGGVDPTEREWQAADQGREAPLPDTPAAGTQAGTAGKPAGGGSRE